MIYEDKQMHLEIHTNTQRDQLLSGNASAASK